MDKTKLLSLFVDCVDKLLGNNFPLPINEIDSNIHLIENCRYYGICRRKKVSGKLVFTIGLNANFVRKGSEFAIITTIFHELLHTLPECNNHGKTWKKYGKLVETLFGFPIRTKVGKDEGFNSNWLKN